MSYKIAPSILSADFARLGEEVQAVLAAGADWIHCDVMDNHFVPNLTIGPTVIESLRRFGIDAPIDVHLMVEPVDSLIPVFAKAGATWITFHPEASKHVHRTIHLIKQTGCCAGIALDPATPISLIEEVLPELDMILVMSVDPGFGGQMFIPSSLDKIRRVHQLIKASGHDIRLQVDGGVNLQNIKFLAEVGADTFVAGSAIFQTTHYADTIAAFRAALPQGNA